jgi:NitT/TauT family transport system permease protein
VSAVREIAEGRPASDDLPALPDRAARARRLERWAPVATAAVLLVLWQLVCSAFGIADYVFPSPLTIVSALFEFAAPIGEAAWKTFWVTMVGFAIAIVVGVLLGFLVGSSRLAYAAIYPLLIGFNAVPKAALVPILIVWFGIGVGPGVLTAFLISFFPITVNIATGLATLEPELEDVLRVLGAKRWDVLMKVGLPRSLPYFYGSLKIAITLAFVGTVLAEMTAGDSGIGYLMQSAGSQQRMPLAFAGLVVIGAMAMAMYELFSLIERRTTGWAHRGSHDD